MLLRLRSRDGLERVEVADTASLAQLWAAVSAALGVPQTQMALSKDPKLLTSREPEQFTDLEPGRRSAAAAGVKHGDMVYLLTTMERDVAPAHRKSTFESRPFGPSMNVNAMIAMQTRIERQDAPHCASVSFERHAAYAFQSYVASTLAFSVKRGGILYGAVDDDNNVMVDVIYEPAQSATATTLQLERGTDEEARADYLAAALGLKKVGWIFTQAAAERDYIMDSQEIQQMAALQEELGECAVTGVVSSAATDGDLRETHFEAFQVSDQAVKLHKEGWFQPQDEPCGESKLRNPKEPNNPTPVIVAVKDLGEVDNDYFLIPVGIRDHEGPLKSSFPVENRLVAQDAVELREHLQKFKGRPLAECLSDFHLLLWLASHSHFDLAEMGTLAATVRAGGDVEEGYAMILESLAGG
mmetsp:Transcript_20771/g.62557  ORF Transcript_20771/g.62557 Transcript_20771/m.62557 type:complete len:413 (-) Transcript_20771:823-2061(-)